MVRAIRLFAPESFTRVLLVDIALIASAFYAAGYLTLFLDPSVYFLEEGGAARLAPVVVFTILAMYFADLYGRRPVRSRIYLLQQLSLGAGVALISQAFIAYINADWTLPRYLTLVGVAFATAALFIWRLLLAVIVSRMAGARAVLILGTDDTVHRIAAHIRQTPELDYRVAGTLTSNPERAVPPVLGTIDNLREVAFGIKPALIIAGFADGRDRMPIPDMLDLRFGGATIEEAGAAYETICRRVSIRDLRPSRTLFSTDFDSREQPLFVLLADRLIALVLLALGVPFAILFAAAFRLQTGRPTFMSETCAGFRGRPFRSRHLRIPEQGFLAAAARRLSCDAWPQLWNVLIGAMSMVGPRPERLGMARELQAMLPLYDCRQNIRPGITGWAQLHRTSGEQTVDSLEEVEYDLYYIRNSGPSLYAFILLHGLKRGAT